MVELFYNTIWSNAHMVELFWSNAHMVELFYNTI